MRQAGDAAATVERDRRIRIDIEEFRRAGKAQNPVIARAGHQVGKLNAPRRGCDQMQRQLLAGLRRRRAQLRNIEHGGQVPQRIVDGSGRAG